METNKLPEAQNCSIFMKLIGFIVWATNYYLRMIQLEIFHEFDDLYLEAVTS